MSCTTTPFSQTFLTTIISISKPPCTLFILRPGKSILILKTLHGFDNPMEPQCLPEAFCTVNFTLYIFFIFSKEFSFLTGWYMVVFTIHYSSLQLSSPTIHPPSQPPAEESDEDMGDFGLFD